MTKKVKYAYGYPVPDDKLRISFKEQISPGQYWSTPVDVDGLDDLLDKLKEENVYKVTFKYLTYFWEGDNFYEGPMNTEDIAQKEFDWVVEKVEGNHRFIEIYKKKER
jgi:hypothetical protein